MFIELHVIVAIGDFRFSASVLRFAVICVRASEPLLLQFGVLLLRGAYI